MESGNNQNQSLCECKRYFAMALDPIHVGTGGFRLGRVDMSIVREPGTNLPKIPGTSLAGACRAYAAMQEPGKFPGCAGQKDHCGQTDCPICTAFGYIKGGSTRQGLAQIADARVFFFPVHSLAGLVWVTCRDALRDIDKAEDEPQSGQIRVAASLTQNKRLNLGWLMLDVANGFQPPDSLPDLVRAEIAPRAVLVPSKLFSPIVNDNLEVRTSVSIDPATGAAAETALFTYEALPRATLLTFEVVYKDPALFGAIPAQGSQAGAMYRDKIIASVEKGLQLFECLGVGGMNTRGMGRLKVFGLGAESPTHPESKTASEKKEAKP
jgi:CRISPR-associated protein Cmr4